MDRVMDSIEVPEHEPTGDPYERLVYDFLDNVRMNWTGYGCKQFICSRLVEIIKIERSQNDNL